VWQCVVRRIQVQRERERVAVCGEEDPSAMREWQCVVKRIQAQRESGSVW
jgi:hypothetical protein